MHGNLQKSVNSWGDEQQMDSASYIMTSHTCLTNIISLPPLLTLSLP